MCMAEVVVIRRQREISQKETIDAKRASIRITPQSHLQLYHKINIHKRLSKSPQHPPSYPHDHTTLVAEVVVASSK
jgi:hypothetical protein